MPSTSPEVVRPGGRLLSLDVLRGLAALCVSITHAYPQGFHPDPAMRMLRSTVLGQFEVTLFFALSGYLVAGPWLAALRDGSELPDTVAYGLRRAARLFPAYWVVFCVAVALDLPESQVQHWWEWPLHLLLLQAVAPGGEYIAILGVAWTLGIELLFSVLLPVVVHAVRARTGPRPIGPRSLTNALVTMWLVAAAFMVLGDLLSPRPNDPLGWAGPLRYNLQTCMGIFAAGGLVAVLEPWRARSRIDTQVALTMAGIVAVPGIVVGSLGHPLWVSELRFTIFAATAALLIWAVLVPTVLEEPRFRAVHALGRWSYGLYLWHTLPLYWLRAHDLDPARLIVAEPLARHSAPVTAAVWAIDGTVVGVLGLALGALSWRVVEAPSMRWARRVLRLRRLREQRDAAAPVLV